MMLIDGQWYDVSDLNKCIEIVRGVYNSELADKMTNQLQVLIEKTENESFLDGMEECKKLIQLDF